MAVTLEGHCVLLHRRPYRETSYLADFFTRDYGKIRAVCRGIRSAKSDRKSLLQPFQLLQVGLSGRHELKSLSQLESVQQPFALRGHCLFSAMYINEVLNRALPIEVPMQELFERYTQCLRQLSSGEAIEPVLRSFECDLLDELGYGINWMTDCESDADIAPDGLYRFVPERGMTAVAIQSNQQNVFSGADLIAIAHRQWDESSLKSAKRLLRHALYPILGDKPLKSRDLFRQMES